MEIKTYNRYDYTQYLPPLKYNKSTLVNVAEVKKPTLSHEAHKGRIIDLLV